MSELTSRIEAKKAQLNNLESQRSEANSMATKDARSLERQKLGHLKRLEEVRKQILMITLLKKKKRKKKEVNKSVDVKTYS